MKKLSPMADHDRLPPSLWAATATPAPETPPLVGDHRFDVAVVGGGYTGLSAGLHAAEIGARVVVLETSEPGWGASGRNGGQVIPGLKWDPEELVARLGTARGERLVATVGTAPDFVFDLIRRHDIDCEAERSGWIQACHSQKALDAARERAAQWQVRSAPVQLVGAQEVTRLIGAEGYVGGLFDPRGGKLQPLSYARGLARAAQAAGAAVCGHSPVTSLAKSPSGWALKTPRAKVRCDKVILATNAYSGKLHRSLAHSLLPVASFVMATEPLSEDLRCSILPQGHVTSDTRKLLTYSRLDGKGRLVIGGRGSYSDPAGPEDFRHVHDILRRLFPRLGEPRIAFRWSGRVAVTPDFLPHIHEPADGLLAAVGYNGRGVAMASVLGAAVGRYAVDGDRYALPLPPTPIRPIPFHGLQRLYLAAATAWYRLQDRFF